MNLLTPACALFVILSLQSCVSVSRLPQDASKVDFDDPQLGHTGWAQWKDSATLPGTSIDTAFELAKSALAANNFGIEVANKAKGVVIGEHGLTMHDWNIIAGIYLKGGDQGVSVRVIIEGSKDLGFNGDSTSAPWSQRIIDHMRAHLPRSAGLTVSRQPNDWTVRYGSGFFVASGEVITSYHVIEGASSIRVIDASGRESNAVLIRGDSDSDLALLKTDLSVPGLAFATPTDLAKGLEVCALGFPLPEIQGHELKATFGRINSLSGMGGDPRYIQIDASIQPGSSGGPVIDRRGRVCAVTTAKLNEVSIAQATGSLPQNVNYGVKCDSLLRLHGSNSTQNDAWVDAHDFVEAVRQCEVAIVRIVVTNHGFDQR